MNNFRKALQTTLLFALVFVILSIAIMQPYFSGANFYYQDAGERANLSGTLDFIVCGSSHTIRAFRPDILDDELNVNSYDLAAAHISMKGRYELLKTELARNPVETVILELSYDSLTRNREEDGYEGDFYVLAKLDSLPARIAYFFSAFRPSEYVSAYYDYLSKGFECLKRLVKGSWRSENPNEYKGYSPYKVENDTFRTDYENFYNTNSYPEEIYNESMEYLQKILDLCKENDVQVIMVAVPLSEQMVCEYDNLDVFREWYEEIAAENGLEYYDFNLYKEKLELLPDETAFNNYNHLSNTGAETFTKLFVSVYQMISNGEDVHDLFYGSYEEMESYLDYSGQGA